MPEIKHSFASGKMNKDLDERLVQNGEYRDAMNIQVRTTDGDAAGTVQNIKGTTLVGEGYDLDGQTKIVASVVDEKKNNIYFFLASPPATNIESALVVEKKVYIDSIIEQNTNGLTSPVVVDEYAIVDTYSNFSGVFGPNGSVPYMEINVIDASQYSVGMTIEALDENDNNLLTNAEIQNIDGNTLKLSTTQTGDLVNLCKAVILRRPGVLKFTGNVITGVNIIDDLLFWTDNTNEPKKINITRCKDGTSSISTHTELKIADIADGDNLVNVTDLEYAVTPAINKHLKEEHITVIRKAPVKAPMLEMSNTSRDSQTLVVDVEVTWGDSTDSPQQGDELTVESENFNESSYMVGDILIFTEGSSGNNINLNALVVKATVGSIDITNEGLVALTITIISVTGEEQDVTGKYEVDLQMEKPLFEKKFVRFGYRYKYEDGEYSSFSPWSELAFLPGPFDYSPKKAYNLGMVNQMRQLVIKNFIPHITTRPFDVSEVDILYKETNKPNVYVVKTIKRQKDSEWELSTPSVWNPVGTDQGRIKITSEMIHSALPANQILRSFDNVPIKALAQEITGNRLLFSNYVQGYDIRYPVALTQSVKTKEQPTINDPKKSVKSIRQYKVGMVFGDKYGRETPVVVASYVSGTNYTNYLSTTGDLSVPKQFSSTQNVIEVTQDWNAPSTSAGLPENWMDYVKYFIKETSNEYYNLILDRWYEAEDGNIWLSFPSADRNKVDEETYLILKNEHGNNTPIIEKARYKIIAIDPDAPDDIKVDSRIMGKIELGETAFNDMFFDADNSNPETTSPITLMNGNKVKISWGQWDGELDDYERQGLLKVRIVGTYNDETKASKWLKVTHFKNADEDNDKPAKVIWKGTFGETADMYDAFGGSGTLSGLKYFMEFKEEVVENKPEYDGKFFVKVERDIILEDKVLNLSGLNVDYDPVASYKISYIDSQDQNPANSNASYGSTDMPRKDYYFGDQGGEPNALDGQTDVYCGGAYPNSAASQASGDLDGSNAEGTNIAFVDFTEFPNGYRNFWKQIPQSGGAFEYSFVGDGTWDQEGRNGDATYIGLGCDSTYQGAVINNGEHDGYDSGLSLRILNRSAITRKYWNWLKDTAYGYTGAKMFIDSVRGKEIELNGAPQSAGNPTGDGGVVSQHYYKPTGLDAGLLNDPDGAHAPTVNGHLGRIFISIPKHYYGNDEDGWGELSTFKNEMTEVGRMFSFARDPENNVYKIISKPNEVDYMKGRNFADMTEDNQPGFWNEDENDEAYNGTYQIIDDESSFSIFSNLAVGSNPFGAVEPGTSFVDYNNSSYLSGGSNLCGQCSGSDDLCKRVGFRVEFRRIDKNTNKIIPNEGIDTSIWDPRGAIMHDGREAMEIQIIKKYQDPNEVTFVNNGACFETEPKEDVGLDLYYEASSAIPIYLNSENTPIFAPYNSKVSIKRPLGSDGGLQSVILSNSNHHVWTIGHTATTSIIGVRSTDASGNIDLHNTDILINDRIIFTHDNGLKTMSKVTRYMSPTVSLNEAFVNLIETTFEQGGLIPTAYSVVYSGDVENPFGVTFTSAGGNVNIEVGYELSGLGVPSGVTVTSISGSSGATLSSVSWMNEYISPQNGTNINKCIVAGATGYYEIDSEAYKYPVELAWFNCYSFGNGIESDRIRDDFNANTIDNGVKVSTTLSDYGQETKGSGMIYSGLYNSTSGVNDLNEFNMAEKITKDLNPTYGSIQALKTRDTDVVVFTEDKVLKVLSNKDALFNADGNPQLTATDRVLGTAVPFVGDYGISKNPESLVSDQYRMYFTDMQRGAVLRLSRDGLTPISNVGMKTYFRENLKDSISLLGTFDKVNGEYNLTLNKRFSNTTVSFNEGSKGWVSFKSFIPQAGGSVGGKYITAINHDIYEHHVEILDEDGNDTNRNTFYENPFVNSSVTVLFNDMPGSVKSFKSINYEGSQARVNQFTSVNTTDDAGNLLSNLDDGQYYNLFAKKGWYVESFVTDLQEAKVDEFINKEGKWFNSITGTETSLSNLDLKEFSVQGIGIPTTVVDQTEPQNFTLTIQDLGDED